MKLSLKQIKSLQDSGHHIYDLDGQKMDANMLELIHETRQMLQSVQLMNTKMSECMQQMVDQLQLMNKSLTAQLKKHAPKTPHVNVDPKVEVNVPDTEPIVFEHEVVDMTNTGRPIKIISTPKSIKVKNRR